MNTREGYTFFTGAMRNTSQISGPPLSISLLLDLVLMRNDEVERHFLYRCYVCEWTNNSLLLPLLANTFGSCRVSSCDDDKKNKTQHHQGSTVRSAKPEFFNICIIKFIKHQNLSISNRNIIIIKGMM